MLQAGSTMTLEAWDWKYKNNLDWNHAWGAAPANIIPRWLLGVRPLEPGFTKAVIQPQLGSLQRASGVVPTRWGGIGVTVTNGEGEPFSLTIDLPEGVTARAGVPQPGPGATTVQLDGKRVDAESEGGYLYVDDMTAGTHCITIGHGPGEGAQ